MIRQPTIPPIPKIQIPQIRIPAFRFSIENGKLVCTVYKDGGFKGQLFKGVDEEMAIYTKRTTEAPKIKVIRRWDMEDIMHMCINHNFYTRGDTRAYTKMLNYVKQKEPTPEEIYIVAVDILDHTDENEDQSITNIMGMSDAKIKVIIKRPDEKAGHVTNISASLKNLQKTVEGNIETVVVGENPKVIMI